MSSVLYILHLEDNDSDAELVAASLEMSGILCEISRATSRESFTEALEQGGMDIILSDFSLPNFNGLAALEMVHTQRPDVPFIFVSGTLGEEVAIDALKCGAFDYVFKHRLPRLGPAVRRAVADAEKKRELNRVEAAMIQSEHKYRQLFDCLSEAALLTDTRTGRIVDTNRQAEVLLGRTRSEILGTNIGHLLLPATQEEYQRQLIAPEVATGRVVFEGEILARDGQATPVAISASRIVIYERRLVLGRYRDLTESRRRTAEIKDLKERLAHYSRAEQTPHGPG